MFAKIKQEEFVSEPVDGSDAQPANQGAEKRNKLFKSWILFSIIYLICAIIYATVIFENERERPYRDRLISTIHLIEYSDFELQVEAIKAELEDMIDRRDRKSAIYEFLESSVYALSWSGSVSVKKSKAMIKATFSNGTILKFVDRNSSVHLIRPEIPRSDLFAAFPSLTELHSLYKDIDFDKKAIELQEAYDEIDFSLIEHKFNHCVKWFYPRFILLIFLIWGIPVCLGFLAVCFIIRSQQI